MKLNSTRKIKLVRQAIPILAAWSLTWILGISTLATVAINLKTELTETSLDSEMALYATLVYGLTWFDDKGMFHDEVLQKEPDISQAPYNFWVINPIHPSIIYLTPKNPIFDASSFKNLTEKVMSLSQEVYANHIDKKGAAYRIHAIPTFGEQNEIEPKAMIIVVANPRAGFAANDKFVQKIFVVSLALGSLGLLIGIGLTGWSLYPVLASIRKRERFISATAHELRTPIAALRSVCESALQGDEPAKEALKRMAPILIDTSQTIEDLLVFARLDMEADLTTELVRLDLLVESLLTENDLIELQLKPSIVNLDLRLVTAAIHNLIENAKKYSGPTDSDIRVMVSNCEVVVEDKGPGFPAELITKSHREFEISPSQSGTGLGLAIVNLVATMHGGSLLLENPEKGGARATLLLTTRKAIKK